MNLVLFLYISVVFSLILGEFGQFPFGQTQFSISTSDIILLLNLSALLIWNITVKRNTKIPKNFSFLISFWTVCFVSLLISLNFSGWFYLLRFIIYSAGFYLTYNLVLTKILSKNEFAALIILAGTSLAVAGLVQIITFPNLDMLVHYGYDPHKSRLFSTFLDPNFTGAFLNFPFLIIAGRLLGKKFLALGQYLRHNKFDLISGLIIFLSIILTFSRSAYLMLFAGLFILVVFKKKLFLLPLILIPLTLYLLFPSFTQRINGAIFLDKSASERILSWEKGLIIFQKNPLLGVGFNNLRSASNSLQLNKTFSAGGSNSGSGIDSSLIFVMATTGIFGVIAYFGYLGKVLYDILNKFLKEKSLFSLTLLSIITGLLINSFFINSLFYPPIMFLLFSLLGVFYGIEDGDGEGS